MKILIFGDVYGRLGRKVISQQISTLREKYSPDCIIANIENITSGKGPIAEHARFMRTLGCDILTGGDHIYDNYEAIIPYFSDVQCRLVRPANFYGNPAGKGYMTLSFGDESLVIIQLIGEVFMNHKVYNPFLKIDELLEQDDIKNIPIKIVEFHKEATAEFAGLAKYLDGRVSAVYGTHTHVQTSDAHISGLGTARLTDVGMNGPFDGVIGAEFGSVLPRFLSGIQRGKITQKESGKAQINACFLDIHSDGRTQNIESISYIVE